MFHLFTVGFLTQMDHFIVAYYLFHSIFTIVVYTTFCAYTLHSLFNLPFLFLFSPHPRSNFLMSHLDHNCLPGSVFVKILQRPIGCLLLMELNTKREKHKNKEMTKTVLSVIKCAATYKTFHTRLACIKWIEMRPPAFTCNTSL